MLRALVRALALLLLVSIGHDLAHAGCDPLAPGGAALLTAEAADDAADHCDDVCVPDCYCCSAMLAAGERVRFEAPAVTAPFLGAARTIQSDGVDSIPDPVPRATV